MSEDHGIRQTLSKVGKIGFGSHRKPAKKKILRKYTLSEPEYEYALANDKLPEIPEKK